MALIQQLKANLNILTSCSLIYSRKLYAGKSNRVIFSKRRLAHLNLTSLIIKNSRKNNKGNHHENALFQRLCWP